MKPATATMLIACFAILTFVFAPTFLWLLTLAWQQPDYSHGLLLPLICGYFLWQARAELKARAKAPVALDLLLGGVLLGTAVVIYAAGRLTQSEFTLWLAFFPATLGALTTLCGRYCARILLAPLLILFLAKPFPDALVPMIFNAFQSWTAQASVWILEQFHVPVHLRGNVIDLPKMSLLVEEACSGVRSLLALTTVAAIFAVTSPWRHRTKIITFFAAIALALVFNILRVLGTATLVVWGFETLAEGFFHSFSGLVSFLLGFVALYYFGSLIDRVSPSSKQ